MPTPAKATGTTKKAKPAPKPVVPPPPPVPTAERKRLIGELSDEAKQALAQAVMDFDEPSICIEGRKRFLKEFGLPDQPAKATGSLYISMSVVPGQLIASGYEAGKVRDTMASELKVKVGELLAPLGIAVTGVELRVARSHR